MAQRAAAIGRQLMAILIQCSIIFKAFFIFPVMAALKKRAFDTQKCRRKYRARWQRTLQKVTEKDTIHDTLHPLSALQWNEEV